MKNILVYRRSGSGEDIIRKGENYSLTLSFEQEPEYGEGTRPDLISQYPLEDILDEYNCWLEDSGTCMDRAGRQKSWVEFASSDREDMEKLLTICGKHVYNKEEERNGRTVVLLKVE